jgi:hypothetical protein
LESDGGPQRRRLEDDAAADDDSNVSQGANGFVGLAVDEPVTRAGTVVAAASACIGVNPASSKIVAEESTSVDSPNVAGMNGGESPRTTADIGRRPSATVSAIRWIPGSKRELRRHRTCRARARGPARRQFLAEDQAVHHERQRAF